MVDNKDFISNFLLNQLFAEFIPHRSVNIIVKFGDDSNRNEVEYDDNRVLRSYDDANVANLSGRGNSEVQERNQKCNFGSFKDVLMVQNVLHVHQR